MTFEAAKTSYHPVEFTKWIETPAVTNEEGEVILPATTVIRPEVHIMLAMDETKHYYERQVYTFLQLLGDFGGFYGAIVMAPSFILSFYSPKMFDSDLISTVPSQKSQSKNKVKSQVKAGTFDKLTERHVQSILSSQYSGIEYIKISFWKTICYCCGR